MQYNAYLSGPGISDIVVLDTRLTSCNSYVTNQNNYPSTSVMLRSPSDSNYVKGYAANPYNVPALGNQICGDYDLLVGVNWLNSGATLGPVTSPMFYSAAYGNNRIAAGNTISGLSVIVWSSSVNGSWSCPGGMGSGS